MGDTSEEIYVAPGYDPSLYYAAPGFNIVATMPPAAPATAAAQDAARAYLYGQGYGTPQITPSFFDANKTFIYMAAGAFFLFSMLGGHRR